MIEWVLYYHSRLASAAGVAAIAVILLGASVAFGFFESPYTLETPYNQEPTSEVAAAISSNSNQSSDTRSLTSEVRGFTRDYMWVLMALIPVLFFGAGLVYDNKIRR